MKERISQKKLFVVLFLLLGLSVQIQSLAQKGNMKVRLEEVLSIGSLDDDALFQWVSVKADLDGHIYVTDSMDYSLKKFSSFGKLLKKTGRKGQGPGEFLAPRLLDSTKEHLYVTDQSVPGIQVFDKNLDFQCRIPIPLPVVDFKILSDNEFALATFSPNEKGAILVFDSKGKAIRQIQYTDNVSSPMMDLVSFDFDSDRNLYIAYTFQDKIEKFNREGKKEWSLSLLKVKQQSRKRISRFILPTKVVYKDVTLDNSQKLYVLGGSFSKKKSQDVYVISPEGGLLATFTLPEPSHCIYIDSRNFLYSRANEGITLKKYRMQHVYN